MGRRFQGHKSLGEIRARKRQLAARRIKTQDEGIKLDAQEGTLAAVDKRRNFIEGDRNFDATTPVVRNAMDPLKNLPWDYHTNPDVPVQFSTSAISDEQLMVEAQQAVLGEQSPALAIARSLVRDSNSTGPWFDTLAEVIVESAKNPTNNVFGIDPKAGSAPRRYRAFAEWIKGARRFTLDDDFTTRAYELSLVPPTKLLDLSLIARAPGDRVWIEWHEQVRLRARKLDKGSLPVGMPVEQFDAMGFAITMLDDGTHLVEIVGLLPEGVTMLPLAFAVEPSGTKKPALRREADLKLRGILQQHCEVDQEKVGLPIVVAHGLALDYCKFWQDKPEQNMAIAELVAKMRYCFSRVTQWSAFSEQRLLDLMLDPREAEDFLMATEGDYRYLLAVLALMSSTYTEMDRVERQDRNVGTPAYRHQKNFLTYSKVLLRLPKDQPFKVILRDLGKSVIAHKKRHAVLPHWRERRKTRFNGCAHQMEALSAQQLKCLKCGHLKWFVRDHERGDATLGYVHKDYVVTASRQTL